MSNEERLAMLAAQVDIMGNALLTARKLLRELQSHEELEEERPIGPRPSGIGRNAKPFGST